MNKTNLFGLHIGCKVRVKQNGKEYEGSLIGIYTDMQKDTPLFDIEIFDKDLNADGHSQMIFDGEDMEWCKLILKPLSKITDEDKRAFFDEFNFDEDDTKYWFDMTYDKIQLFSSEDFFDISIEETLWLASKGYDIGIVPDEYKDVKE